MNKETKQEITKATMRLSNAQLTAAQKVVAFDMYCDMKEMGMSDWTSKENYDFICEAESVPVDYASIRRNLINGEWVFDLLSIVKYVVRSAH